MGVAQEPVETGAQGSDVGDNQREPCIQRLTSNLQRKSYVRQRQQPNAIPGTSSSEVSNTHVWIRKGVVCHFPLHQQTANLGQSHVIKSQIGERHIEIDIAHVHTHEFGDPAPQRFEQRTVLRRRGCQPLQQ
nr:thrombospondin-type laminin G domain and EAR repeat-containing protein [uncultured bacterium]